LRARAPEETFQRAAGYEQHIQIAIFVVIEKRDATVQCFDNVFLGDIFPQSKMSLSPSVLAILLNCTGGLASKYAKKATSVRNGHDLSTHSTDRTCPPAIFT
jgi:hypothetical protein